MNTIIPQINANTNGDVTLSWNSFLSDAFQNGNGQYEIHRQLDGGGWDLITTTSGTTFLDKVCDNYAEYRVVVPHVGGCSSVSVVTGQQVKDNTPPDPAYPVITNLTVNESGNLIIRWQPSPEDDVVRYVIDHQIVEQGVWKNHRYDSVGANVHEYTDMLFDGCSEQRRYFVYAVDSCGQRSPISFNNPIRNILLEKPVYDTCAREVQLNWHPYNNPDNPISKYEVWVGVDGGNLNLLSTLSANDTNFVGQNIEWYKDYCFQIRGVFSGDYTSSCSRCLDAFSPQVISDCHIYSTDASVETGIDVFISYAYTTDIKFVAVLRSDSEFGTYEEVGMVPAQSSGVLIFNDASVDKDNPWFYKAELRNLCNEMAWPSHAASSIFLKGELDDKVVKVDWTPYFNSEQSVLGYTLYQIANGSPVKLGDYLDFEQSDNAVIKDDIQDLEYVFFIQALVDDMGPFDISQYPRSNLIRFERKSKIELPNALVPGSDYGLFKPIVEAVYLEGYSMAIFNQWGTRIFETNDINTGWDGSFEGDYVKAGTYVYSITYKDNNGSAQSIQGTVVVIR